MQSDLGGEISLTNSISLVPNARGVFFHSQVPKKRTGSADHNGLALTPMLLQYQVDDSGCGLTVTIRIAFNLMSFVFRFIGQQC